MRKIAWNTKGVDGIAILPSFSNWLQGQDFDEVVLRVQGGTISQTAFNTDWKQSDIDAWVSLVEKNANIKLVYVVNMNQLPADEATLYNRMSESGLVFDWVEMGNEQYLRKYTESLDKVEVTDRTKDMTPQKYLSLCAEYTGIFNGVPTVLQLAPSKGRASVDVGFNAWNDEVLSRTNDNPNVHYSMHIYPNGGTRWEHITETQAIIGEKPLLITEFGGYDVEFEGGVPPSYEEFVEASEAVAIILKQLLRDQDIPFSQVLWNNFQKDEASDFKDGELTDKGKMIVGVFAAESEPEIEVPEVPEVIEAVLESYSTNYDRTFWGSIKIIQALTFSDGTIVYNTAKVTRRGTIKGRVILSADIGKTKEELKG
jgi:hypothetical protein